MLSLIAIDLWLWMRHRLLLILYLRQFVSYYSITIGMMIIVG